MISTTVQRNGMLDAVKAFAIVCVVLGHCIQYGSGTDFISSKSYLDNIPFQVIYSFHMPLFMLISGYLFRHSVEKGSWQEVIAKKAKTLLVPIFVWALLPTCIWICTEYSRDAGIHGIVAIIQTYLGKSLGNLWFLWAIFWCSTIVTLIHRFLKDNVWVYAAVFILTMFTPDGSNMHLYKFMYPFFATGYIFGRNDGNGSNIWNWRGLLPTSAILYILLMSAYDKNCLIYVSRFSIINSDFPIGKQLYIDLYRTITGLAGSIMVIQALKKIYPGFHGFVQKLSSILGQNTMGIYIISGYILMYAVPEITKNLDGCHWATVTLECIAVTVLSLLVTILIKKSRILSRLLLGR